jgi:hypothetical protein
MSKKHLEQESEEAPNELLQRRLRMTSQRYQLFFRKAGDILGRVAADREVSGETSYSRHTVHMSDFISVDDVNRLIESNELRDTGSWRSHRQALRDVETSELSIDDWPEVNDILDELEDRHDAVAQILALNDSFAGFIMLLVSWVEFRDDYRRLFTLSGEHGHGETELQLELAEILPEEVPELPEDDLLSATIFIMEMVKKAEE